MFYWSTSALNEGKEIPILQRFLEKELCNSSLLATYGNHQLVVNLKFYIFILLLSVMNLFEEVNSLLDTE